MNQQNVINFFDLKEVYIKLQLYQEEKERDLYQAHNKFLENALKIQY